MCKSHHRKRAWVAGCGRCEAPREIQKKWHQVRWWLCDVSFWGFKVKNFSYDRLFYDIIMMIFIHMYIYIYNIIQLYKSIFLVFFCSIKSHWFCLQNVQTSAGLGSRWENGWSFPQRWDDLYPANLRSVRTCRGSTTSTTSS